MGKDYVRKELEDKLDELSAIEKNALKELTKLPEGKIYAKRRGENCCQFFWKKDSETDWQYLKKSEDKFATELIQREYTEKVLKTICEQRKLIEKFVKKYNEKSVEETDDSSKALDELQKKYDDIEDKYLRAEAEMANMTQRFKKEQEMLLKYEGQDLARDILPVIDNLNRALEIEVDNDASQQLKKGIEMVARDMEKALKNNNVTKIDSLGKVFDPTLHQAVKTVPVEEGQEPETIVQVFQDGYMLKDRVLRPAMVVVAQ